MKTNKLKKKLSLKKSTIADLNNVQMNRLLGGATAPSYCEPESACGDTCPYTCGLPSGDITCLINCTETCTSCTVGSDIAASCIKCSLDSPC